MTLRRVVLALFVWATLLPFALAHEMRPAYLLLTETEPDVYSLLWRVPTKGDRRLRLYLRFPHGCIRDGEIQRVNEVGALVERWTMACQTGLAQKSIIVEGLSFTQTDVLLRIGFRNGSVELARATPEAPSVVVKGAQTGWQIAHAYFWLGVDHILTGYDHLLFVFALILLIDKRSTLVKTITAFTLAHSLTLAAAALRVIQLPQAAIEAVIALSIAFVARDLVLRDGRVRRSSTVFQPWAIALVFGLLHGLGFAGALHEAGLPQTDVPTALLTFNLGVEVGQLAFVVVILSLLWCLGWFRHPYLHFARPLAAYAIGGIASAWLIERLALFVA